MVSHVLDDDESRTTDISRDMTTPAVSVVVIRPDDVQNWHFTWRSGSARRVEAVADGVPTVRAKNNMGDESIAIERRHRLPTFTVAHQNDAFLVDPRQLPHPIQCVQKFFGS